MNIKELINIKNKDVISIVGAGGKTSLMYLLGRELRNSKVLLSTTTKILPPTLDKVDFYGIGHSSYLNIIEDMKRGSFLYGKSLTKQGKIDSLLDKDIENILKDFDYIVLEADGSKEKPLKGWREDEPVVSNFTTKTIGVLDITVMGKKIDEEFIHRLPIFLEISKANYGEIINSNILCNMIFSKDGLFKNSLGEKILFINKVEEEKDYNALRKLLEEITLRNRAVKLINKVIYGSLKYEKFNFLIEK